MNTDLDTLVLFHELKKITDRKDYEILFKGIIKLNSYGVSKIGRKKISYKDFMVFLASIENLIDNKTLEKIISNLSKILNNSMRVNKDIKKTL